MTALPPAGWGQGKALPVGGVITKACSSATAEHPFLSSPNQEDLPLAVTMTCGTCFIKTRCKSTKAKITSLWPGATFRRFDHGPYTSRNIPALVGCSPVNLCCVTKTAQGRFWRLVPHQYLISAAVPVLSNALIWPKSDLYTLEGSLTTKRALSHWKNRPKAP